jgi:hypothetical protein
MDFSTIIHGIFSTEGGVFFIAVILIILYEKFVKPRLERLAFLETHYDSSLRSALSKDDYIMLRENQNDSISNSIIVKLKPELDEISDKNEIILERIEDVKIIAKNDILAEIKKIKSIIESLQVNFSVHDDRSDSFDDNFSSAVNYIESLFELLSLLTTELEKSEIIHKVNRPTPAAINKQQNEIDSMFSLFSKLNSDKSAKTKLFKIMKKQMNAEELV